MNIFKQENNSYWKGITKLAKNYVFPGILNNSHASLLIGRLLSGEVPGDEFVGYVSENPQFLFVRAAPAEYRIKRFSDAYLSDPSLVHIKELYDFMTRTDALKVELDTKQRAVILTQAAATVIITPTRFLRIVEELSELTQKVNVSDLELVEFVPLNALKADGSVSVADTVAIETGTYASVINPGWELIFKIMLEIAYNFYPLVSTSYALNGKPADLMKKLGEEIVKDEWNFMDVSALIEWLEFKSWMKADTTQNLSRFIYGGPWLPRIPLNKTLIAGPKIADWMEKEQEIYEIRDLISGLSKFQGILDKIHGSDQIRLSKTSFTLFPGLEYFNIGNVELLPPISMKNGYPIGVAPVYIYPIRADMKDRVEIKLGDDTQIHFSPSKISKEGAKNQMDHEVTVEKTRKVVVVKQRYSFLETPNVYIQKNEMYDAPLKNGLVTAVSLDKKSVTLTDEDLRLASTYFNMKSITKDYDVPLY